MAVSVVLGQVETICKGISGVTVGGGQGWPEPLPVVRAPFCSMELQAPQFSRLTGGASGAVETRYTVLITLVLGGVDMPPKRALALATPFIERFRLAFWADPTLGGACWRSELSNVAANLRGYRKAKTAPSLRWRLLVSELVAADSGLLTGLVAGQFGFVAIGAAGAESEITPFCSSAGYAESAAEHDTTPYGVTAQTSLPGLTSGFVQLEGLWSSSVNALLAGLRRTPGQSIVLGPGGSGVGQARISASGFLRDYAVDFDQRGAPVSWRAFFRATSEFAFDSF